MLPNTKKIVCEYDQKMSLSHTTAKLTPLLVKDKNW